MYTGPSYTEAGRSVTLTTKVCLDASESGTGAAEMRVVRGRRVRSVLKSCMVVVGGCVIWKRGG